MRPFTLPPRAAAPRPAFRLALALALAGLMAAQDAPAQAGAWGGVAGIAAARGYVAAPGAPDMAQAPAPVPDATALAPAGTEDATARPVRVYPRPGRPYRHPRPRVRGASGAPSPPIAPRRARTAAPDRPPARFASRPGLRRS